MAEGFTIPHPLSPIPRAERALGCNHRRSMVSFLALSRDPVAQWIRALPCGGRGRAFESPQGRQVVGGRSRHLALGRPSAESAAWGGDGAVERARLENELGLKAHVGSNPTLPANYFAPYVAYLTPVELAV